VIADGGVQFDGNADETEGDRPLPERARHCYCCFSYFCFSSRSASSQSSKSWPSPPPRSR
jgi:hypothetical protein